MAKIFLRRSCLPVTVCECLSMGPRKSARKAPGGKNVLRKGWFHSPGLTLNADYTVSALKYDTRLFGYLRWKKSFGDAHGDKSVLFRPWPHDSLFGDFVGCEPYYYEDSPSGARPEGSLRFIRSVDQFISYFRCAFLRVLPD